MTIQQILTQIKDRADCGKEFKSERISVIIKNACYYDDKLNEYVIDLIINSVNDCPKLVEALEVAVEQLKSNVKKLDAENYGFDALGTKMCLDVIRGILSPDTAKRAGEK